MKFYEPEVVYTGMGECNPRMLEDCDGQWATRADAEQAVKDAVEMAKEMQQTHD